MNVVFAIVTAISYRRWNTNVTYENPPQEDPGRCITKSSTVVDSLSKYSVTFLNISHVERYPEPSECPNPQ
jgi:hypothetical protein